jgi:biopolymer transport protein ExbD
MKLKNRGKKPMPEVNLVPMMDVVLTILTFFIIMTMSMSNARTIKEVSLPSVDDKSLSTEEPPNPLIVVVNKSGQMILEDQPVDDVKLAQAVVAYLEKNPKGAVVLKADKGLNYEKVVQAIAVLRDIGGDKVSLAIE